MKTKKVNNLPIVPSGPSPKALAIIGESLVLIDQPMISTYRKEQPVIVNTNKPASIRGGVLLYRINVYNHLDKPNIILLSIWTRSASPYNIEYFFSKTEPALNSITVSENSNGFITFNVGAPTNSRVVIEDLSEIYYPLTFV